MVNKATTSAERVVHPKNQVTKKQKLVVFMVYRIRLNQPTHSRALYAIISIIAVLIIVCWLFYYDGW